MTHQPLKMTPGELREMYGDDPERILGMRLRALREEAGLTQAQMAERMTGQGFPMHQTTVAKIEANQRPVRVNEAVMFAAILNLGLPGLLADPELDEEAADLRAQMQQAAVQRLEAETQRASLQAEIAALKERLAEAGRRWTAAEQRERELTGQWLLARKRARGRIPAGEG